MFYKKFSNQRLILIISIFLFSINLYSQVNWTKYENNPVLDIGESGSWDCNGAGITSVIYDNGIYKAWYAGLDSTYTGRIGYATSVDGIHWIKDTLNNPVLDVGVPSSWDWKNVDHACVLKVNSTYKMWYSGEDSSTYRIGYATSDDGIHWVKDTLNNPVLDIGAPGSWDENEVFHASVVFDGSTYHMWYNGYGQSVQRTGYATSGDGIHWTKDNLNNPCLDVGDPDSWDDYMLALMGVIYKNNEYKMWYTGGDGTDEDRKYFRIGYATSIDGIHWIKDTSNNPVLNKGEVGTWDSLGVVTSSVIFDTLANEYKMWFGGIDGQYFRTGYATSDSTAGLNNRTGTPLFNLYILKQNYPNPYNQTTTIEFSVPKTGMVKLNVFNTLGQLVRTLLNEEKTRGKYKIVWDGRNDFGEEVTSGTYIYQLVAEEFISNKMMILLK